MAPVQKVGHCPTFWEIQIQLSNIQQIAFPESLPVQSRQIFGKTVQEVTPIFSSFFSFLFVFYNVFAYIPIGIYHYRIDFPTYFATCLDKDIAYIVYQRTI